MGKLFIFSLAFLLLLCSCKKDSTVIVDPDLQFTSNGSVHHFPSQCFGMETNYYVNKQDMPGAAILGYQMAFKGRDGIAINLRKKFQIKDLENPTSYFDNLTTIYENGNLSEFIYQLSDNEFQNIIRIGDYEINNSYTEIDEGVIIYIQKDFENSSYISTYSSDIPNQNFRIDELRKISKSDLANTGGSDMDIGPGMFSEYKNIYLGKASFNLTLINSEKSDTIRMNQGLMTFVIYY